jgi:hypothetical protein
VLKMYSFLSPENLNYLKFRLRQLFPPTEYEAIRSDLVAIAGRWWKEVAPNVQEQFVGGTQSLNEKFLEYYIGMYRVSIARPHCPDAAFTGRCDMYSSGLTDMHLETQPFQQIDGNVVANSNGLDSYNPHSNRAGSGWTVGRPGNFGREVNDIYLGDDDSGYGGGIKLRGTILDRTLASVQRIIVQKRDKNPRPRPDIHNYFVTHTLRDQDSENMDSRAAERPVRPRTRFTLPQNYETFASDMRVPYQMRASTSLVGAYESAILPGTDIRIMNEPNGDISIMPQNPIKRTLPRDRSAEYLMTQNERFLNSAYYHRDVIPRL